LLELNIVVRLSRVAGEADVWAAEPAGLLVEGVGVVVADRMVGGLRIDEDQRLCRVLAVDPDLEEGGVGNEVHDVVADGERCRGLGSEPAGYQGLAVLYNLLFNPCPLGKRPARRVEEEDTDSFPRIQRGDEDLPSLVEGAECVNPEDPDALFCRPHQFEVFHDRPVEPDLGEPVVVKGDDPPVAPELDGLYLALPDHSPDGLFRSPVFLCRFLDGPELFHGCQHGHLPIVLISFDIAHFIPLEEIMTKFGSYQEKNNDSYMNSTNRIYVTTGEPVLNGISQNVEPVGELRFLIARGMSPAREPCSPSGYLTFIPPFVPDRLVPSGTLPLLIESAGLYPLHIPGPLSVVRHPGRQQNQIAQAFPASGRGDVRYRVLQHQECLGCHRGPDTGGAGKDPHTFVKERVDPVSVHRSAVTGMMFECDMHRATSRPIHPFSSIPESGTPRKTTAPRALRGRYR